MEEQVADKRKKKGLGLNLINQAFQTDIWTAGSQGPFWGR